MKDFRGKLAVVTGGTFNVCWFGVARRSRRYALVRRIARPTPIASPTSTIANSVSAGHRFGAAHRPHTSCREARAPRSISSPDGSRTETTHACSDDSIVT